MRDALEKFDVYVTKDFAPSDRFVIWADNPFQAVSGCKLFDEYTLVETNSSLNKYVFTCTMAEPHAVRPCDLRRVVVYKVG